MSPLAAGGVGYLAGLATVLVVYVAVRPTLRAHIARGVNDVLNATHFRIGALDLGPPPPELSRVIAAGVALGVARALP